MTATRYYKELLTITPPRDQVLSHERLLFAVARQQALRAFRHKHFQAYAHWNAASTRHLLLSSSNPAARKAA